ncbi:hypothetical protein DPMN_008275 [Dreissena polymorpha]|uniref:Uncharacterized protein n=1 Tax=Dreissena polymorpha TaxID=45954 RepID=A0A9D4RWR9_DREPO|nr:hypothetical protein DPMN_008275 [Dreissena polymorpha]
MSDITQIAAVHLKTGFKFSSYVETTMTISSEVQKVIGISVYDHGILSVNGGSVVLIVYQLKLLYMIV